MIRWLCLFALSFLSTARLAYADHFLIDLEAKSGAATKTATVSTTGSVAKPKARGILEIKPGESMTVKWTVTYTAKQGMVKDQLIHFFVVKEEKVGQVAVPKLDKDVAVESALTMDFNPKDKTDGELTFTLDRPGSYLLRLEASKADGDDHEHFAALDIVVKGLKE